MEQTGQTREDGRRAKACGGSGGFFACHAFRSNVDATPLISLDDVADFLRTHPRSGVRMNPQWKRLTRNIYIEGALLR
ncbi:MAG: hypothetical protein K5872_11325 [Rhizobiaceae bacterium]|jgi:hypothetical protein|nr:hypothetical protein [Rhizobiaceae bacterium]MCV0406810.1 hypothetical protein [Rhizobiaceae bacterium]